MTFLENLAGYRDPELKIAVKCPNGKPGAWTKFIGAEPWRQQKAVIRTILKDEIILDIDEKTAQERVAKLKKICQELQNAGYHADIWFTGSKGYHLHVWPFPELALMPEEQRKMVRLWFCKKYNTDEAKQTGMIAIENAPHFKTGNPKTLYCEINKFVDENKLPIEAIEFSKNYAVQQPKVRANSKYSTKDFGFKIGNAINCPFHKFRTGHFDKKPSCLIKEGYFRCFSCKAIGSHRTLAMQIALNAAVDEVRQ